MAGEFRAFLLKTNALALAVGVIIGVALGAVVNSLVNDIIMPPVGFVLGGVDFSSLQIVLGTHTDATGKVTQVAIRYGNFINGVISFIVVAFVVFMISRAFIHEAEPAPPAPTKACPYCREANAIDATRCKFCTSAI